MIKGGPGEVLTLVAVFLTASAVLAFRLWARGRTGSKAELAVRLSRHNSLLQAVSDTGEGLVITRSGRPVYVNEAYASITGYSVAELMAMPTLLDLVPTESRDAAAAQWAIPFSSARRAPPGTSQLLHKDGRRIDVENALRSVEHDGPPAVVSVVRDISARRRAEELRTMQLAVARVLSESASLDDAAPQLLRMVATALRCQIGRMWLVDPRDDVLTLRAWWQAGSIDAGAFEEASRREAVLCGVGLPGRVWLTASPVATTAVGIGSDSDTAHAAQLGLQSAIGFPVLVEEMPTGVLDFLSHEPVGPHGDIVQVMADLGRQIGQFVSRRDADSALRQSLARLAEVAATDPLTGLRNRREFERQLSSIPRRPFAVLAIDIDNLKQTNDEHGHEGGDVVLRGVALTLASLLRGWDVVARVGGDEFAVLLLDAQGTDAALAGERMRLAIHAVAVPYGQARITVGWAAGPAGADPHAIWRSADADLFMAKREGRDRVGRGNVGERRGLSTVSVWAKRIERALDGHHLDVVFQPIVRLVDGMVVGHEVLARPDGCGPCDPVGEFFTEAERLGRIKDIDWLCRRMAIESLPWPAPGDWALFLNVRTLTLLDPVHDVDQMLLLLRHAGGSPEQVVLEISEQEIINDYHRLRVVLAAYREHGFRFALDDVGAGNSTLELLGAANAEFIKVGHGLTSTATRPESRAAIRVAAAFARSSGATLLAEGIDSDLVIQQMEDFGVVLGQGWRLGRPRSIEHPDHVDYPAHA